MLVLDFGSQYAQLIARRVRELNVYCEIVRHDISVDRLKEHGPAGLILSGGPNSVYEQGAPKCDPRIFDLDIPVLGICYGMQLACEVLGSKVSSAAAREYGRADCYVTQQDPLFADMPSAAPVWMSHGDQVQNVGPGFIALARTGTCPVAAVRHESRPIYGIQFHPEVTHTPHGTTLLRNFLFAICGCEGTWRMENFAHEAIEQIRQR
ncbi:MAG TPA: glutamine-hydrolyzing GMP synthase, partial [Pirellulaceae bacterium]|nr:glutamine-hydrolyzing GMP synthase [Pirellulaceae bacterium]